MMRLVTVTNPVTGCNMPVEYLADSDSSAASCASANGFQVVTSVCEYIILLYSADRRFCVDVRLFSNSSANAQTCVRQTNCASCLVQDITSDVTPYRVPPSCIAGIDWGLVDRKRTEICGH